ncbi:MAG: T9SS type A sorting domain-containing protein [Saprospiraceae bacterium]|nr:T9SS type A sorting domain-containing protein [Saprospiraceae bacterium]
MKGIVAALILTITCFALQSQVGFNKKFNLNKSNAYMGSVINNDTLMVLGASTDFVKGWQFSAIGIDTNGLIISIYDHEKDSFQQISWSAENSKLVIKNDGNTNIMAVSDSQNDEIDVHFVTNLGTILKSGKYKVASSKESKRLFGVLKVSDGYLISGQVQYSSETVKSFILKIDRQGNKIYIKYYGEKDFWFLGSTLYQSPVNENEVVLYGSYISHGYGHKSFFHIDHKTGNILRIDITPGQTVNSFGPYSIYYSSHFNSPIGVGIMSNENQTALLPALVVFNDSFKVVRKDYFGINADQRYNGGDVEEPYQSAQDSEGNIYIATIQFLPFEENLPLYQVIEAFSITKFDKEHNHLWTTIDTVFHDGLYHGYAGYLSGVSVSSSGSVFITGHYAGPNPDEGGIWRNTAYVLKYDKDGCKVGGCRLVNSDDSLIWDEQPLVYPNPVNEKLYIEFPNACTTYRISIINTSGQTILHQNNKLQHGIDVSQLQAGLYILKMEVGGRSFNCKIVKQ